MDAQILGNVLNAIVLKMIGAIVGFLTVQLVLSYIFIVRGIRTIIKEVETMKPQIFADSTITNRMFEILDNPDKYGIGVGGARDEIRELMTEIRRQNDILQKQTEYLVRLITMIEKNGFSRRGTV